MEREQMERLVYNKYKQNSPIQSEVSISSGLPNLMNTCFLNSILQQLYQIAIIHTIIASQDQFIDIDQANEEEDLLMNLKVLFRMMSENVSVNDKRHILSKIVNHMTRMLLDYEAGSQYDSFETFTCIFDYLVERRPELSQYFEIQYNQSCQCPYDAIYFASTSIEGHKIICIQCNSQIRRQFVNLPNYLVVNYEKGNGQGDLIGKLQNSECQYTLESRNIYNGSGRSGHYYSECRYGGQFHTFDDSLVRLSRKNQRNKCLFAVYKKNMKINDANSSKLKNSIQEFNKVNTLTRKNGVKADYATKKKKLNKFRPKQYTWTQPNRTQPQKYIKVQFNEQVMKKLKQRPCQCYIKRILPKQLKIKTFFEKIMQFLRSLILQKISHIVFRIRFSEKNKKLAIKQKIDIIEMS